MKWPALPLLSLLLCGCSPQPDNPPEQVTFASCLAELTNPLRLATGPVGKMVMSSSYDKTGGNNDNRNFHGTHHDGSQILAQWNGPGCVRRIWMTGQRDDQQIQFFFDGEKKPSLVCTYGELKAGTKLPFIKPLCDDPSSALISYVPIPFSKSLVISAFPTEKKFFYYQINGELFPRKTAVRNFPLCLSQKEKEQLCIAQTAWDPPEPAPQTADPVQLRPGVPATLFEATGPAMISSLSITPDWPDNLSVEQRNRLLRTTTLKIYWNNQKEPSIAVPLGDFFLNGRDLREHHALLFSHLKGTWTCRLPMPFEKGVRIEIQSTTAFAVAVAAQIEPLPQWNPRLHYLHATWNQANSPQKPLQILHTQGSGHLAGCYITLLATDNWNLLEGDDRIFIDGEKTSSLHGTGLEDYFNGGWYYGQAFNHPFGGALEDGAIKTTQYRFHQPDPVSFKKSIFMEIEFGHANRSLGHMASTAFYYLKEPGAVPFPLPEPDQRLPQTADPFHRNATMVSVFEAERLGDLRLARDLCTDYIERYRSGPDVELMQLRLLAYQNAPDEALEKFRETCQTEAAKQQANLLLTLRKNLGKALLTTHINGAYELYLDGALVLSGDSLITADARLVDLSPGRHVLAAKVQWPRPDNWITIHLRNNTGEWFSDSSWKNSDRLEPGWTRVGFDDTAWALCRDRDLLPKMSWFSFYPNAFPFTQHRRLTGPAEGLDSVGETPVFFRKEFVVQ